MKKLTIFAVAFIAVLAVPFLIGTPAAQASHYDDWCDADCYVPPVNRAPVCEPIGSQTVQVGESLSFALNASDADGDELIYTGLGLPSGASVNRSTGVFTWNPDRPGSRTVTMKASDGDKYCTTNVRVTVQDIPAPAPAPAPAPDPVSPVDNTNTNTNNNNNTNTNINTNTINIRIYGNGTISGTNATINGRNSCNNGLDDDHDGRIDYNDSDCDLFGRENGRNIRPNKHAPVFVSRPVDTAREGALYVYEVRATDRDDDDLQYGLLNNPAGMTIDHTTGRIQWVPSFSQGGSAYRVTVGAFDGVNETTQDYQLFVENADIVTASGPRTGQVASAATIDELRAFNIRVDTDELQNSVVTWETTLPSTGHVIFGRASQGDRIGTDFTGANQYEFATPETPEISTMHRIILGQLESERVYYFRVASVTGSAVDVSSERSFVQLPSGETLNSNGGFASALENLGSFLISPWFLLLVVIALIVIILVRRNRGTEVDLVNEPLEVSTNSHGHGH